MILFEEGKDYEFVTAEAIPLLAQRYPNYAYVTVKDNTDYSQYNEITENKKAYLVVKVNEIECVEKCIAYAIGKHVPSLTNYNIEIMKKI